MAITILSQPLLIEPVYSIDGSNLSIVVDSTDSAFYSFRYVQQIAIGATVLSVTRVAPNVEDGFGKGVLQPNRILEDLVSRNLHRVIDFNSCDQSFIEYNLRIGEESDGTIGGTGASYSITYGPTVSGYIWNGTYQYASTYTFADYLVGLTVSSSIKFLTQGPTSQDINIAESSFLYFLLGVTASGATSGSGTLDLYLRVRVTDGNSQQNYFVLPTATLSAPFMYSIAMGPPDLNALVAAGQVWSQNSNAIQLTPIITCATTRYEVKLGRYVGGGVSQFDFTETRTYEVDCDCERYTPFRFAWLNPLGGMDTYTFRLKSSHTITADKQEFTRYLSRYNVTNDTYGYLQGNRGRKIFDVQAIDIFTVVSTWQTEEEHAWLAELFRSPEAYLITTDNLGEITYDPIIITKNSVEIRDKTGYGNRLLSHTVEFQKSYPIVVQRTS